jgi:hypothetical protein
MKPACRWIETEAGAVLHWHYACIATVKRRGDHFETCVEWQGHEHTGRAGSLGQGIRYVTRWVEAQKGFPTAGKRNVIPARFIWR